MTSKNEKVCIVLGPPNSGKTQLLKTIRQISQQTEATTPILLPPTQPTTGTNMVKIETSHGSVLLKEYGGKMAPLWQKTIPIADMLLYVIDSSNPLQISSAVVLLMDVLSNDTLKHKPILIYYNKTDTKSNLSLEEYQLITRVDDIKKEYKQLEVMNGSCLYTDTIGNVISWLCNNNCQ